MLNSAIVPNTGPNIVHRFGTFTKTRGDSDYADTTYGTLSSPVYTGYVWISATVKHTIQNTIASAYANTPTFNLMIIPVSSSLTGVDATSTFATKKGFSTNNAQSSGTTSWGLWPVVQTATISTLQVVTDGFTKYQIGIYRSDAAISAANNFQCIEFSILPLGDVSGLVNALERITVVE